MIPGRKWRRAGGDGAKDKVGEGLNGEGRLLREEEEERRRGGGVGVGDRC